MAKKKGEDVSKIPFQKAMTYIEKVNYMKGELKNLLDKSQNESTIKNSVYRLGSD